MVNIRNDTSQVLDFIVSGSPVDGVPPTDSVAPGETKEIDVAEDDVTFKARVFAGAIAMVPGAKAAKASNRVPPAG